MRRNQIQIIELGDTSYLSECAPEYLEAKGAGLIDEIWALDPEKDREGAKDHINPKLQIKVVIPQKLPPRHPRFAGFLEVGKEEVIDAVEGRCCHKEEVTIFFPERHLSPKEIHAFMWSLTKYNPQMKRLRLMTQSCVIISEVFNYQFVLFQ